MKQNWSGQFLILFFFLLDFTARKMYNNYQLTFVLTIARTV